MLKFLFSQHGTEKLEKKLKKLDGIPVVTDATWKEVVEQSHAPYHPFVANNKWSGEVTKTNLVSTGLCRLNTAQITFIGAGLCMSFADV
jgi:hypothetical protein